MLSRKTSKPEEKLEKTTYVKRLIEPKLIYTA